MKTIWKDVPGYEGKLMVSSQGTIKSIKRKYVPNDRLIGKTLSGRHPTFYLSVSIEGKTFPIHRIVASVFIPNPDNKSEVGHKDNDPLNNKVENLNWVTHSENQKNSSLKLSICKRGENHPRSLLFDRDVLDIIELRKNKVKYKVISEIYGVSENTLSAIVTRGYKHLTVIS